MCVGAGISFGAFPDWLSVASRANRPQTPEARRCLRRRNPSFGLLGGQFKVVLASTSTSGSNGFNSTNPTNETATVDATFGFTAYE